MAIWLFGSLAIWLFGYLANWLNGYLAEWLSRGRSPLESQAGGLLVDDSEKRAEVGGRTVATGFIMKVGGAW